MLDATPITQYWAETPAQLSLAAEPDSAYRPSKPSQGAKPRRTKK